MAERNIPMTDEERMINRVTGALRRKCLEIFGSAWSIGVGREFAIEAIEAVRESTLEITVLNESGPISPEEWNRLGREQGNG